MDFRKLALKDDKVEVDYDNIPEQRSGGRPNLPPGRYIFGLPKNVADAWAPTRDEKNLKLVSDRDHPIAIVRAIRAADETLVGEIFYGQITTVPLNRARKGDPDRMVPDTAYLLKEGFGDDSRPKKLTEVAAAISKHAGEEFSAEVSWSATCNKENIRYIEDAEGQSSEDPEGVKGCGKKYYQKSIPRDADGYYQERFNCTCGASLRCFQNLGGFGKAV